MNNQKRLYQFYQLGNFEIFLSKLASNKKFSDLFILRYLKIYLINILSMVEK
jgi:hypothetical protein